MIFMKKVKINYLAISLGFIMGFSGFLKEILLIYSIILLHEMGHMFFILLFKGKIEEVRLTLLGGIIKVSDVNELSKKKKFLINIGRHYYKPFTNYSF